MQLLNTFVGVERAAGASEHNGRSASALHGEADQGGMEADHQLRDLTGDVAAGPGAPDVRCDRLLDEADLAVGRDLERAQATPPAAGTSVLALRI